MHMPCEQYGTIDLESVSEERAIKRDAGTGEFQRIAGL